MKCHDCYVERKLISVCVGQCTSLADFLCVGLILTRPRPLGICSLTGAWVSVLLAHGSADENKHPNPLCGPEHNDGVPVICNVPRDTIAHRLFQRGCAHHCVWCKEHRGADDENDKLDETTDVCAVGREDSCSPPPSANKHAEEVKDDETEGDLVNCSNNAQTRAKLLAVHIAVLNKLDVTLKDISIEFLVLANDSMASPYETGAPIHGRSVTARRVIVDNSCHCLVRSANRGLVRGVEILNSLAPRVTHFFTVELHGGVGFLDPSGVPTGSSVVPHDFVRVVHLLPFLVLVSGPANGIVRFSFVRVPDVVMDCLVSLLLSEVRVVWCYTLDTNLICSDRLGLPALLDVFEVLDILGIEHVILELSMPVILVVHVDVVIEHLVSGEDLGLELIRAVSHRLHGVVVAVSDCEHEARPADDLGLVTPGFLLDVLFEVPGFPLESLEDIHFPVTA